MANRRKPDPPTPARDLVSVHTFALHAGVSDWTIRRWAAGGTVPIYRLPGTGSRPGPLRLDLRDLDLVVRRERPESVPT